MRMITKHTVCSLLHSVTLCSAFVGASCVSHAGPSSLQMLPAEPAAPPAVSTPTPKALDLPTIVRMAVGNNTLLSAAQIRLQKAQELIAQVNAQNRPQLRIDAEGYITSYGAGMPSLPTLTIGNPFVPGGAAIPDVQDIAG